MKNIIKIVGAVIVAAISVVMFQNCSGGGGGSSGGSVQSSSVKGLDFSGTWIAAGVACYNSSLTVNTNNAVFTNGYTDTVMVTGNTYVETRSQGGCTAQQTGNLVFQANTMTISGASVTNATNGSCSMNEAISNSAITPTNGITTYTTGQPLQGAVNVPYVYNPSLATPEAGLLSTFSDGNGGYCFIVYQKQ